MVRPHSFLPKLRAWSLGTCQLDPNPIPIPPPPISEPSPYPCSVLTPSDRRAAETWQTGVLPSRGL